MLGTLSIGGGTCRAWADVTKYRSSGDEIRSEDSRGRMKRAISITIALHCIYRGSTPVFRVDMVHAGLSSYEDAKRTQMHARRVSGVHNWI